ncbi:MAG: hypothetical protein P4L39_01585 [Humidesulfovibrio sp.]|nr:hypothetical protein [Humidesulfovibrio sp.]
MRDKTEPNAILGQNVLRGLLIYKTIRTNGGERLCISEVFAPANPSLKNFRSTDVEGWVDLLISLLDNSKKRLDGSFHEAEHVATWITTARSLLSNIQEVMAKGDTAGAVLNALQGAMLTYDVVAELQMRAQLRDRNRQRGAAKGGQKTQMCKGILELLGKLAVSSPGMSATGAWDKLAAYDEDNAYSTGRYKIFMDGHLGDDPSGRCLHQHGGSRPRRISKETFRRYWSKVS